MENLILTLNKIGEHFAAYSGAMLIQSGVLIVLLLIIDWLIRKRVRAVFRYCIWMLVFIKLLLPPSLCLPTGIGYWYGWEQAKTESTAPLAESAALLTEQANIVTATPKRVEPAETLIPQQPVAIQETAVTNESAYASPPQPEVLPVAAAPLPSLTWQAFVFLGWLVGVLVLSVVLVQRFLFVKSLIAQSEPAEGAALETLERCRNQVGLNRSIQLRLTANMLSPAACGLRNPVVLMPASLLDKLTEEKLRTVLIHELAHIKRGDLWVNFMQTLLQIVYFYNPLLWVANAMVRGIREKAVDEMVLTKLGDEADSYSTTLIDIAEIAFSRPHFSLRLVGVVESKKALTGRIKHILSRPFPKSAKIGLVGLTAVFLAAAVLLPMAKASSNPPEFIVKGTVIDAETGLPIVGAKVGDNEKYNKGEFSTVTDSKGQYEYKTWYEEHGVTADADGYIKQDKGFITKLFGSEKEKVINFKLTNLPDNIAEAILLPEHFESHTVLSLKTGQLIPQQQADDSKEPYLHFGMLAGQKPASRTIYNVPEKEIGVETGNMDLAPGGFDLESKSMAELWSIEEIDQLPNISPRIKITVGEYTSNGTFISPPLDTSWPFITAFKGDDGTYGVFEITKVQDRKIYVRFKTFKNTDESTQNLELKTNNYNATLPNGVTVELLGVCEHPSEGKQWWSPDGVPLEKVPYQTMGSRLTHDKGFSDYEFVLRTVSRGDTSFTVQVPGGKHGTYTGTPYDQEGNRVEDLRVYTVNQPEDKNSALVRIGATADKWQTRAVYKPDDNERTYDFDGQCVGFNRPYEDNGDTILPCTHNLNKPDVKVDIRVVAIRKDGEVRFGSCSGYGGNVLHSSTYQFKSLPLEGIKQFEFQTRPYQWVTFKNVSLRPGGETEVEIQSSVSSPQSSRGQAATGAGAVSANTGSIGKINLPVGTVGKVVYEHGDAIFGSDKEYSSLMYLGRVKQGQKIELIDDNVYYNQYSIPIVKVKAQSSSWAAVSKGTTGWIQLNVTDFAGAFEQKPDDQLPQYFKELQKERFEIAMEEYRKRYPGKIKNQSSVSSPPASGENDENLIRNTISDFWKAVDSEDSATVKSLVEPVFYQYGLKKNATKAGVSIPSFLKVHMAQYKQKDVLEIKKIKQVIRVSSREAIALTPFYGQEQATATIFIMKKTQQGWLIMGINDFDKGDDLLEELAGFRLQRDRWLYPEKHESKARLSELSFYLDTYRKIHQKWPESIAKLETINNFYENGRYRLKLDNGYTLSVGGYSKLDPKRYSEFCFINNENRFQIDGKPAIIYDKTRYEKENPVGSQNAQGGNVLCFVNNGKGKFDVFFVDIDTLKDNGIILIPNLSNPQNVSLHPGGKADAEK